MIPQFPTFAPLSFDIQEDLAQYYKQHPPYSDFNFTSMWTWNTKNAIQVSFHNKNLIVLFTDYLTGKPFFSVLGTQELDQTLETLLTHARETGISEEFQLIPEIVAAHIQNNPKWSIVEDADNHDYILCSERTSTLRGNKLRGKKNFSNRILRHYGDRLRVEEIDLCDTATQKSICDVLDIWSSQSSQQEEDIKNEYIAIQRLLTHAKDLPVYGVGVFVDDMLVAFSIDEVTHDGYGIIHYEKANRDIVGSFPFLKQQSARYFLERNCQYINYEQDLGIEGLKKTKKSFQPVHLLKKFRVFPARV